MMSSMFTNLNLPDMETCYRSSCARPLEEMTLKSNRFGFEPEITAKIAKAKKWRIYEGADQPAQDGPTGKQKRSASRTPVKAFFAIIRYWRIN
ncbi:MAG: hypothetical protein U0793_26765 [Gemmataceae bacterium]